MNDIVLRSISGIIFVFAVVSALFYGIYSSAILLSLFYILGLIEFYRLFENMPSVSPAKYLSLFAGIFFFAALISPFLFHWPIYFLLVSLLVFPVIMINELYRGDMTPLSNIGVSIFGWVYLALPLFLIFFINFSKGWHFAIGLFVIVWTNDTFAYLTGRFLGKTKLFERISPKKTWEGTIGGILFSILASYLWSDIFNLELVFWMISAFVISISAVFGDLVQSMFKRSVNVKDSGNIMPGHGGILDRFDAVLFSAPIFFVLIYFYYN